MGNRTDPKKWSARERLLHLEQLSYWRGWVRRQDLVSKFGISVPQASADFAAYCKLNPGALRYDASLKRYVSSPTMRIVLSAGRFDEAVSIVREMRGESVESVVRIDLPLRTEPTAAVRQVVSAALSQRAVEIHYYSVNSGRADWRWISPHAFANDGYRWHIRAWCHRTETYKDFVFGRIGGVRGMRPVGKMPVDAEWQEHVRIRFRARKGLTPMQRQAVELDFGMRKGVGHVRVRRAMLFYTLAYLGLSDSKHPCAKLLEPITALDSRA